MKRVSNKQNKTLKALFVLSLSLLMIIGLAFSLTACGGTTELVGVFFDSTAAANGDGSQENPYNDLSMIEEVSLEEGDNIYLKRGSDFKGGLDLVGLSGTEETPLYVTDYGSEEDGMPKIDGEDMTAHAVIWIESCSNIVVENIEVYDSYEPEAGDDLLTGKSKRGVFITGSNPDAAEYDAAVAAAEEDEEVETDVVFYNNITVQNLYVHNIRGLTDYLANGMSAASKACGGILMGIEDEYTSFENVYIHNNEIEDVDNVGIATRRGTVKSSNGNANNMSTISPYNASFYDTAFRNVQITDNEIHNIGKNAIFIRNAYDSIVEGNTVYDTATRCYTGNQIVSSRVYKLMVEKNEGYLNNARVNDNEGAEETKLMDGCMLDPDLESRDTIWQYNYSHDNAFGLLLNCTGTGYSVTSSDDKVIVRYNLSVNDHGQKGLIYVNYASTNMDVYNNTFITADDTQYIFQTQDTGASRTFNFYNNIVYNTSPDAEISLNYTKGAASNNLIYSTSGASVKNLDTFKTYNTDGVYTDPELMLGVGESIEDRTGYSAKNLSVSTILDGSPAFDAGCAVQELVMGEEDDYVPEITEDIMGRAYSAYTIGCSVGV